MIKRRIQMTGLGLLFLAAFLLLSLSGSLLAGQSQQDENRQETAERADLYRNQGLEPDRELAQKPEKIEEDLVSFSDRVMVRCGWTEEELQTHIQALKEFLTWTHRQDPEINTYVSVLPLRIGFEAPFSNDQAYRELVEQEREKLAGLEKKILKETEGLALPVPVMDTLTQHQEEYLFYRAEASWTARGAYYAGQEFLKAAGLETFPIDAFWEYAQGSTTGELAHRGVNFDSTAQDWQYYYLYKDYNPMVDWQDEPGVHKKVPMVTRARVGRYTFLGSGGSDYCKWKGKAENGRSLLIVDEWGGNVLAPWMVTQFEDITYVDIRFFNPDRFQMEEIFREQGVTDLLMVVNSSQIGIPETVVPLGRIAGSVTGGEER